MPLDFRTPWLLLGLLAAAIPVLLHLLSSVRAPEVYFPTLRFLQVSMEKTARRRRLEHWLLLLIRSLLLAFLAMAVAEPFLRAAGAFGPGANTAAVLILDNSYSMGLRAGGTSRFDHARREAAALLGGASKPSRAAVLLTNAAAAASGIRSDLGEARERLAAAHLASGRAALAERVDEAVRMLEDESAAQKAVYIFSDRQRNSFEPLPQSPALKRSKIPLMLVDCAGKPPENVGVSELTISGQRVAQRSLEFSATLVNSSPAGKVATVSLHVDGQQQGPSVRKTLAKAGRPGSRTTVRFRHAFTAPGFHVGQVAINESDDLPVDNVRRFSLEIADRVAALLVRGQGQAGNPFDPAMALRLALDPYEGSGGRWPVHLRTIPADEFDEGSLAGVRAAFFADVPGFTEAQASALERLVRTGGSAVFFLGPGIDPDSYNEQLCERFAQAGGLLPGRIGSAIGQVGLAAPAVRVAMDLEHPYLKGLYETKPDYPEILLQRYYRVRTGVARTETILSTPAGDPILTAKDYHAGRVVLCATTASSEWSNLPTTLLLPLVARICLEAGDKLGGEHTHLEGAAVPIRPRADLPDNCAIVVTRPDGTVDDPLPLGEATGLSYANTRQIGVYHWQVSGAGPADESQGTKGSFVTNPDGAESDLSIVDAKALAGAMRPARLFHGSTVEEVHAAAAEVSAERHLWDRLLAVVILLLVVEAVVANRFRRGAEPIPRHLNPRMAA